MYSLRGICAHGSALMYASLGERYSVALSSRAPLGGGEGEVGDGLLDELGDPVGEPDTTNRPPVLMAAEGGTEGVRDVTGRVYVSTAP